MSGAGSRRLISVVGFIAFSLAAGVVQAQTRSETLRYVTGASGNTLDPNIPGSTREAFAVSLSTYGRLVSVGRKQLNAPRQLAETTLAAQVGDRSRLKMSRHGRLPIDLDRHIVLQAGQFAAFESEFLTTDELLLLGTGDFVHMRENLFERAIFR